MTDPNQLKAIQERSERLRQVIEGRQRPRDDAARLRYVALCALVAGDVPALLADREELIALLREVEWKGTAPPGYEQDGLSYCPCCAGCRDPAAGWPVGHTPSCPLAAALR
jgi:hypothetical protein